MIVGRMLLSIHHMLSTRPADFGFDANLGNVEIYYTRGLFFRYPDTGEVFASSFADIQTMISKGNSLDIRSKAGKNVIIFSSPLDAINFSTLLDGLCAIDARGLGRDILQVGV